MDAHTSDRSRHGYGVYFLEQDGCLRIESLWSSDPSEIGKSWYELVFIPPRYLTERDPGEPLRVKYFGRYREG
jgi:hypothetical protein